MRAVSTELHSPANGRAPAAAAVHCHVKVLLLLYGLPRLLSGSIMAHELMHAWLRMEGCMGLSLKVEEGLCQLMACLWLDRQHELLKGVSEDGSGMVKCTRAMLYAGLMNKVGGYRGY